MKKEKNKEGKVSKWFRRIFSLGAGGAVAAFVQLFPNEIIAWASAGVGFLYGKGAIDLMTMVAAVTFLGSALGILVQTAILSGLSFLVSNVILKLGRNIFVSLSRKKTNTKNHVNEISPEIEHRKVENMPKTTVVSQELVTVPSLSEPVAPIVEIPKQKTLGVHPSLRNHR